MKTVAIAYGKFLLDAILLITQAKELLPLGESRLKLIQAFSLISTLDNDSIGDAMDILQDVSGTLEDLDYERYDVAIDYVDSAWSALERYFIDLGIC